MDTVFICNNPHNVERVYGRGRRERIEAICRVHPEIVSRETFDEIDLSDVRWVFSTWGMPELSVEQIARMPKLEALFYAAGSVKFFAPPFLERDVRIFGAWGANAVAVADFTLGQILLATKGYFRNQRDFVDRTSYAKPQLGIGNFEETVALIGAGMVGRMVIDRLRPFDLVVQVADPYLSDEDAQLFAVERVSLEDAFRRALVVSNHAPNLPATMGMIQRSHFESMREHAVFINTGRGATVDEEAMIAVLRERPDLTALLDVMDPEPPIDGSPFYELPNAHLTNHIAGAHGRLHDRGIHGAA